MNEVSKTISCDLVHDEASKFYHVGTLSYTRGGLIVLFCWMLWGDFCFTMMETVVPSILPIKLKALNASNVTIAMVLTTLPGILNMTFCPWVSFWSDRYRSRWGRRIPFMLFTLPFLTLFLILLGFSEQISLWIYHSYFTDHWAVSFATVSVATIGVFMACFQFFQIFVGSVYWYFFNDVVPQQCMGQFMGLFRLVGGLAGVLYNLFIFKHAESHMTTIFLGAGLLYFLGFSLMCFKVKEGNYPPPPKNLDGQKGFFSGVKTFLVECYSIRFYWYMFGMTTFWVVSESANIFNYFFVKDIGMTLEQYGKVLAYSGGVGLLLTYPAGCIADRYHPMRVEMAMKIVIVLLTPINLIFLFVRMPYQTAYYCFMVIALVQIPAKIIFMAAQFPNEMHIFPKERFGQFCSAQALVRSIGTILGGLIVGLVFDGLKSHYMGSDYAYRWVPAWNLFFEILSLICLVNVYRGWKRYGGLDNYIPPFRETISILKNENVVVEKNQSSAQIIKSNLG